MKKIITCLFIFFVGILFANPVQPGPAINEIFFDENGWQIEIMSIFLFEGNLDFCAISGINGYSEFNPGITFDNNDLVVVTIDDLQNPFVINAECDSILTYWDIVPFCYCGFGTEDQGVINPFLGQSLRLEKFYINQTSEFYRHCKDDSPTIGTVNDTTDYKGHVFGNVLDAQMNAVPNAEISFEPCNFNDPAVLSNEFGQYSMWLHALNNEIQIIVNNTVYSDTLITIEPGQCSLDFILEDYIPSDVHEMVLPYSYYNLTNYPNPFNPTTEISFSVPQTSSFVTIEIFNSRGQAIKTIKIPNSSSQNPNQITWDGTNETGKQVPSGVYLYKLVSNGKELAVNKMLLLK